MEIFNLQKFLFYDLNILFIYSKEMSQCWVANVTKDIYQQPDFLHFLLPRINNSFFFFLDLNVNIFFYLYTTAWYKVFIFGEFSCISENIFQMTANGLRMKIFKRKRKIIHFIHLQFPQWSNLTLTSTHPRLQKKKCIRRMKYTRFPI